MEAAEQYLKDHGVDLRIAEQCGVRSDGLNIYFQYEDPYGVKYERTRSMADGICRQPAGRRLDMYWPLGKGSGLPVLLCEGEADALAAATILADSQHEFLGNIVPAGVPGASAPAGRMSQALYDAKCGVVYVCFDADDAGRAATKRVVVELERLNRRGIPIELPDGKDLADCLVDRGDEAEEWLANLLADHSSMQGDDDIIVGGIRGRLGSTLADCEADSDITPTGVTEVRQRLAA